jgi:hypothetical protein
MNAVGLTRGNICNFPVTQLALGDAWNLSAVHVNRSFMEVRGRGLITPEKHTLTILEWEELQQHAEFAWLICCAS